MGHSYEIASPFISSFHSSERSLIFTANRYESSIAPRIDARYLVRDVDENGGIIAPEEPANSMLKVIFFLQLLNNTVLSHSVLLQMMCSYLCSFAFSGLQLPTG